MTTPDPNRIDALVGRLSNIDALTNELRETAIGCDYLIEFDLRDMCTSAADTITALRAEATRLTAERDAAMAGLNKIADGYGPNHLSKYARDMAQSALAALQPETERQPLDVQLRAINDIPEDPLK